MHRSHSVGPLDDRVEVLMEIGYDAAEFPIGQGGRVHARDVNAQLALSLHSSSSPNPPIPNPPIQAVENCRHESGGIIRWIGGCRCRSLG